MKQVKKQKIFFGVSSLFYTAVFLIILIFLNMFSIRHYKRFDVTTSKIYSLSEKTISIIKNLKKDVTITVLYSKSTSLHQKLFPKIENILKEYQMYSEKMKILIIDPERDIAQTQLIAKKYNIETAGRIIVECGEKVKHLTDTDIAELDFSSAQYGG